jgi:hypothetical protein
MKSTTCLLFAIGSLLLLAGCVTAPTGPSVMALPGSGKSFEQFRYDDADCRQFAQQQTGGADRSGVDAGVRSAAVGTVVGAVAGTAIGGQSGAGVGAGTGLVFGSMAGAGAAQSSAYGTQRGYDNAFVQCMYAKGHKVPVSGSMVTRSPAPAAAPANVPQAQPSGYYPPPPPPDYSPPPGSR